MNMRSWLAVALLALAQSAQAHLMPAGQGGMRVEGNTVTSLVSVPVAVLSDADDDGNGRLSLAELNTHRASIEQQVARRFHLSSGGIPEHIVFQDLLISDVEKEGLVGATHLVLMRRSQWSSDVSELQAHVDLFPASGADRQISLRALRQQDVEFAVMDAGRTDQYFFQGPVAAFRRAVETGAEHILLGYDHLLFLLTVLVAAAGWRYWFAVITAFTVAHSCTLALAALGAVSVSEAIVEPLIAASIVLVAIDNLVRRDTVRGHRLLLVFGCGLLHGLGIASALAQLGLSNGNRIVCLVGFNVGVELGQMVFVASALVLFSVLRRLLGASWQAWFFKACSVLSALAGAAWMLARLLRVA